MNRKGAARVAFGQYKAWVRGIHHPGTPQAHEALVQAAPVLVYRDMNQDFRREGAPEFGLFGINQHWGYDLPKDDLGRSSAGCLWRDRALHRNMRALGVCGRAPICFTL